MFYIAGLLLFYACAIWFVVGSIVRLQRFGRTQIRRNLNRLSLSIVLTTLLTPTVISALFGSVSPWLSLLLIGLLLASLTALVAVDPLFKLKVTVQRRFGTEAARHDTWGKLKRRLHVLRSQSGKAISDRYRAMRRDINLSFDNFMARVASIKVFFRLYGLALTLLPLVLAVTTVSYTRTEDASIRALQSVVFGYNALLVAAFVTTALVGTLALVSVLRVLGVFRFRLLWLRMLKLLAASVGIGTACGAFTGALVPAVELYWVSSGSVSLGLESILARVSPQLMLEIPAWGAIVGYVIGCATAIAWATDRGVSSIVRRLVLPGLFIMCVYMLLVVEFSPRHMFARLSEAVTRSSESRNWSCAVIENQPMGSEAIDVETGVVYFSRCNPSVILADGPLGWGIVSVVVFAVVAIWFSERCRKGKRVETLAAEAESRDENNGRLGVTPLDSR